MKKINPVIGQNIFICGGSCSGKTSAVHHIYKTDAFNYLNADTQLGKLTKDDESDESMRAAFNVLVNGAAAAALKKPLIMDHWMPPRYEERLRELLISKQMNQWVEDQSFYVWLYCSSKEELKRRSKQRYENGDGRQRDLIESSQNPPLSLEYHYILDTNNKKPKEVARLILKKANKHWSK